MIQFIKKKEVVFMENYEIKLEQNKKRNEKYLKEFESWLNNK